MLLTILLMFFWLVEINNAMGDKIENKTKKMIPSVISLRKM